eukprot:GHVR01002038.1.p1 GENE.GHVR01002038.1~~GHVR01002038.1.p1  ORF type:complete len:110 (+),score=28.67 GHVR01002038.1:253-582(+)
MLFLYIKERDVSLEEGTSTLIPPPPPLLNELSEFSELGVTGAGTQTLVGDLFDWDDIDLLITLNIFSLHFIFSIIFINFRFDRIYKKQIFIYENEHYVYIYIYLCVCII